MSSTPTHHVFVDFENVPTFDLDCITQFDAFVTVLIGKSQTKLDMNLALQVKRHASKVELIQTAVSGRNALDLILAYHLGRAAALSSGTTLHVVSKDKDFDPLLSHLKSNGVSASRCASFSELPFVAPSTPKKKAASKKKTTAADAPAPVTATETSDTVMEKIISHLRTDGGPRPKRESSLLRHIGNCYGNRLTETELAQKLETLTASGLLSISPDGKVTY